MKEHPIIFSTEMVKAILDGRKSQTRRVIKPQPYFDDGLYDQGWIWEGLHHQSEADLKQLILVSGKCPYGQTGDRLWVREAFAEWQGTVECVCNGDLSIPEAREYIICKSTAKDWVGILRDMKEGHPWTIKPSIHMPRWASRITLEITEVRVERVQEISPSDVIAEGIIEEEGDGLGLQDKFANLWDSINAKRKISRNTDMGTISGKGYSWASNPWVWCLSFRQLIGEEIK